MVASRCTGRIPGDDPSNKRYWFARRRSTVQRPSAEARPRRGRRPASRDVDQFPASEQLQSGRWQLGDVERHCV
jgi:hypothetical protein